MENTTKTKIETWINYLNALIVRVETEDATEDDHIITDEIYQFIESKTNLDDSFYLKHSPKEMYADMVERLKAILNVNVKKAALHMANLKGLDWELFGEENDHKIINEAIEFLLNQKLIIDYDEELGFKDLVNDMIRVLEMATDGNLITPENLTERELADAFIDVLNEWLEPDTMAEIILQNEKWRLEEGDDYSGCATHDHCDSNMAMAEAWMILTGTPYPFHDDEKPETEKPAEHARILFNAAWTLAKLEEFKKSK